MQFSLRTLFFLNTAFVLFPVISPDRDITGVNSLFFAEVTFFGQLLSSVLTPLLVGGTVLVALSQRGRRSATHAQLLFPAGAVSVLMMLSATFGEVPKVETLVMCVFFLLFNIYLSLLHNQDPGVNTGVLKAFKNYFTLWLVAPLVAMAIDPSLFDMFFILTVIDVSYHGLTNSRVGFGLWVPLFLILMGRPGSRSEKLLFAVALVTLLLSQSRAAIFGLLISYAYGVVRNSERPALALQRLMLLASLCAAPLWLWSVFGRDDALTVVSEDRGIILAKFGEFIEMNWLFGHGGMYVIDIPEIDKLEVPAHNFMLQTVANFGVFTLLAFLVYFVCLFRFMRSTRARMMLIFLFIYSMYQPVQGTANFFSPITLLIFLITFAVDNVDSRHASLAPKRAGRAKKPLIPQGLKPA